MGSLNCELVPIARYKHQAHMRVSGFVIAPSGGRSGFNMTVGEFPKRRTTEEKIFSAFSSPGSVRILVPSRMEKGLEEREWNLAKLGITASGRGA